ncbi:MAG TPA: phospholipase D-like domain-containing protein [Candidatus Binatia bacterium]|nr:phospholipase D-like domain-containing protein [Candidatus Binatia bacterium]
MSFVKATQGGLSITAYRGDFKTLLAFDLAGSDVKNLAGFTIAAQPQGAAAYYLLNDLQFQTPGKHAQDPTEPPNSSINAPFQKLRWVHVPGMFHQGLAPAIGPYTYTVTPRYFDENQSLEPMDSSLAGQVTLQVAPFSKGKIEVGFTRGFTQSQAFVHHFGLKALIQPPAKGRPLIFDTKAVSGKNAAGQTFTYADEYRWLGFTAREKIFALLQEVTDNKNLTLDVFAYDLTEPDIMQSLIDLGKDGRVRIVLDNASLHHDARNDKPEDRFEQAFRKAAGGAKAPIRRGHFKRYSHDKVLVVSSNGQPQKVLTGSTNFSVTGLYVNSNHVLVFNDPAVAATYENVFQMAWEGGVAQAAAVSSPEDTQSFRLSSAGVPPADVTFAPHSPAFANGLLDVVADRVKSEGAVTSGQGSVLFAVMGIKDGNSPVYDVLRAIHKNQKIFSYGISDDPGGIALYKPGSKSGVLVTGKPVDTVLPPPFNQVPNIGGIGHQVHHKFVVCAFNNANAFVVCGSSNLASGGEASNGDNLLQIYDQDVATVFAIEALALVDHFQFLNRCQSGTRSRSKQPPADTRQRALDVAWYLSPTDAWVAAYYKADDLHYVDRVLFSGGSTGSAVVPPPWRPPTAPKSGTRKKAKRKKARA